MNLRELSNQNLVSDLKSLVLRERELLTKILHHIREVDQRRLYLDMGFGSLFEFVREELGYSEAAASRRIQAMRLIRAIPEVETKIESGTISLSVASQLQRFIYQDQKREREIEKETKKGKEKQLDSSITLSSPPLLLGKKAKLQLVERLEGASSRECEQVLAKLSPETSLPRDRTRFITAEKAQVSFTAGKELLNKIERLKTLTFHQNPEGKLEKVLEKALDLALDKLDPERREAKRQKCRVTRNDLDLRGTKKSNSNYKNPPMGPYGAQWEGGPCTSPKNQPPKSLQNQPKQQKMHKPTPTSESPSNKNNPTNSKQLNPRVTRRTRTIPLKIKDKIWLRERGKCQFENKQSGKKCGSEYMVEIDHAWPYSLGGGHDGGNLRLYCREHNQHRAIEAKL